MINLLKKRVVMAAHLAGGGHVPSALSILDIVWNLYDKILTESDRFILSKGHGCLALYAVLEEKGLITLESFGRGGILGGHPDRNKVPGVVCSTGSLGHGHPQAVGIALAKKIKGEPGRVYCLVGDGECNEGSIWESALLANHHKLDNLMVIVDNNHTTDRAVDLGDIGKKFEAFGFFVYNNISMKPVPPGEPSALSLALNHGLEGLAVPRPVAVIAETVKGSGVERMADPAWHHRAPNGQELKEILEELS